MESLPSSPIHQRLLPAEQPLSKTTDHSGTYQIKATALPKIRNSGVTRKAFDEIPVSDSLPWNSRIQTHLRSGDIGNALLTYEQMLLRGVRVDMHTLPRVLAASRLLGDLSLGKQVHGHALKLGHCSDNYVISSLIEMYGILDGVESARWVFDKSPNRNPVSWTLLAKLYLAESKPKLAVDLFKKMVRFGVEVDSVALGTALVACGQLKSLRDGRHIHEVARKLGFEFDVLVSNALVRMYIDCRSFEDALTLFDRMPDKDVVMWTTIIQAHVKMGGFNESLKLLRQMSKEGISPDTLSVSSILPACGRMTASKCGKEMHGYLLRNGLDLNLKVQNALVDMYVKSGSFEYALKVFGRIEEKDAISWTVMVMGSSLHGQGGLGIDLFHGMEKERSIELDELTYGAALQACASSRMVEKGKHYFNRIREPKVAHCISMVSLLASSGLFEETSAFIEKWKLKRSPEALRVLLHGCRINQEVKLGKRVIEQLCELEPLNAENYVLLSNWYAHFEKWDMVHKYRQMILDMGLKPQRAYSWIEHRNKVHVFRTGDVSHPRSQGIYWELEQLMEKAGNLAKLDFSLHDVDEERECPIIGHSEMLAVSFGLVSKQSSGTIRVTKNHQMCRGCHAALKAISRLEEREIIVKDLRCFHHFKGGFCSCGDLC
ncbi:pentatricopeptide repeat-containing protein DOT4, chloroplastic-like [Punica granatum]|uniref:DYW domain-containing protein n=2 Tax=Punica granatum TaxID=22663 RepID=A0A218XYZ8_PUNGR|nr:pentatricopeptide repeat-containing protein DOT4, chloroplastic-like [Punica granatum]OWM89829.1 hypothetical protein CDL15_Pgr024578 [Punica granatum]PKI71563.1 hypothetical protein CRG98_008080 [Punica granatum]